VPLNLSFIPAPETGLPHRVLIAENVVYGRGGDVPLVLNLFRPEGAPAPLPVVVFIHGGGWHGGMKEDYRDFALQVAGHGYLCLAIDYRVVEQAPFPAAVEDCKCALRWVRAHAADLGADPERIATLGHSAGGHLAALLAVSPGRLEGEGGWPEFPSTVQAVLCYCGPSDLATLGPNAGPAAAAFVGADPEIDPARWRQASALSYLTGLTPGLPEQPIPFLVCHGIDDDLVPVDQSDRLVAALEARGWPVQYLRLPGNGHDLAPYWDRMVPDALAFLGECFRGPKP